MFEVRFYKFNKKINSTKLPNVPYVTEFCNIKTPTSYTNPIIEIEKPSNIQGILDWNYCYIVPFHRYYFISNITFDMGLWVLELKEDFLATYKNDILNSTQYVLRSASNFDSNITDDIYITTILENNKRWATVKYDGVDWTDPTTHITSHFPYGLYFYDMNNNNKIFCRDYFNMNYLGGSFVLGIIGGNATGVTYYAMNFSTFRQFIQKAMTLVPTDMTDVSSGIANAIYDPLQYMTSCTWYPYVYTTGASINTITVGGYDITVPLGNIYQIDLAHTPSFYIRLPIPKHSDYNNNNKYLNLSPYTELNLYFQPFGNIALDTTKIYGEDNILIAWVIDYTTGTGKLTVSPDRREGIKIDEKIIVEIENQYGVSIPLSSIKVDWKVGAGLTTLGYLRNYFNEGYENYKNTIGKYVSPTFLENADFLGIEKTGKKVEKATKFIDNVSGALSSSLGQMNTKGTTGSFLPYAYGVPYLYACYYGQTEQDISRFGKPLRKIKKLNTLSGFCLCENADVTNYTSTKPLLNEQLEIENYLNSGIYIE